MLPLSFKMPNIDSPTPAGTPYELTGKIQCPFMIKVLERIGIEETFVNIIYVIYIQFIVNINLNGDKLKNNFTKTRSNTKQNLYWVGMEGVNSFVML